MSQYALCLVLLAFGFAHGAVEIETQQTQVAAATTTTNYSNDLAAAYAAGLPVPAAAAVSASSSLLSVAPYRAFDGYSMPATLTPEMDARLQALAAQYRLNVSDLYQWYDMILAESPTTTSDQLVSMITQLSSGVQNERYNLYGRFGYPAGYYGAYGYGSQYVKNTVGTTVPGYVTLYRREPQQPSLLGAISNDISSNASAAYNNMLSYVNRVAPETSQSMRNIVNAVTGNVPSATNTPNRLSDMLNSNIRYMMSEMGY